jgi:hypothetical protein
MNRYRGHLVVRQLTVSTQTQMETVLPPWAGWVGLLFLAVGILQRRSVKNDKSNVDIYMSAANSRCCAAKAYK